MNIEQQNAELQAEKSRLTETIDGIEKEKVGLRSRMAKLEEQRPVVCARVVLVEGEMSEVEAIDAELQEIKDRFTFLESAGRGVKLRVTALGKKRESLVEFETDQEEYERLKGRVAKAEEFRPMWDNEVRQFGPLQAGKILSNFIPEMTCMQTERKDIQSLYRLARSLDCEVECRDFISSATGQPVEAFLES